jgi:hypothetical protein
MNGIAGNLSYHLKPRPVAIMYKFKPTSKGTDWR